MHSQASSVMPPPFPTNEDQEEEEDEDENDYEYESLSDGMVTTPRASQCMPVYSPDVSVVTTSNSNNVNYPNSPTYPVTPYSLFFCS